VPRIFRVSGYVYKCVNFSVVEANILTMWYSGSLINSLELVTLVRIPEQSPVFINSRVVVNSGFET